MIDNDADFGPLAIEDGGKPGLSAFDIFVRSGRMLGIWLRRSTWRFKVCCVVAVERPSGRCEAGPHPVMWADFYNLKSGDLTDERVRLLGACSADRDWRRIDPPAWSEGLYEVSRPSGDGFREDREPVGAAR